MTIAKNDAHPVPADVPDEQPIATEMIPIGTKVEVRSRFDQHWSRGFEVAAHSGDEYDLRRLSDGEVLPVGFSPDSLRKERKKSTWWY